MSDTSQSQTPRVVSESIEIAASPETVFAILTDPQQHPRIDGSGSVRGVIQGPDRLSKDATFGVDMKLFGLPYKMRNTVVEFEEGRRIAWRHSGAHRWRYVLEPTPAGTRVTESFDYSMYSRPERLLIKLARFPARNRKGIKGTLVNLKEAAEADSRSAS